MPAPAWEDLDAFFDVDDFATTVQFARNGVQVSPLVKCIFDDPYLDKQLGEFVANSSEPRITCKAADVALVKKHDDVTIASMPGRTYSVLHDPTFDGTGTCVVYLARES